jgi:hypothetical protein
MEVTGNSKETQETTQETLETYRNLAKMIRQAIQVKLKPMLSCQENLGKAIRSPMKSQEAQETQKTNRKFEKIFKQVQGSHP